MRKKTSCFFSAKKNARDVGILAQVRKTVLALSISYWHRKWARVVNRASLPLPMWSSGDSRPPVPWSAEERRREMTNLIANQKGAASTFYNYAPDDVHDHDVDVTRWASRGVAEAVPLDSCTPRAMPPRACCILGLCLYRGSA